MRKLYAAALAALLGTAVLGAGSAMAQSVSAAVGRPLIEARQLADAGKYREAMAAANTAGGAAKTPFESKQVEQTKQYIAIKSGDASIGGALGAKAKFARDYEAGRWNDVIADGEGLAKTNSLDAQSHLVIAQAFFQLHNSKGCMNYIRSKGLGGESALALLQRCAYDAGDEATQRQALEQLVGSTGKTDHWKNLLRLSERARGMKDHNTLDVYRLKSMTGNLENGSDVMLYAQLALQMKSPAEAKTATQKGIDNKMLNADDRTNRLLKLATDQTNAFAAGFAAAEADARKQPQGDALVALGEGEIGQGKAKEAIALIQAGNAKGMRDPAEGQLRLGYAYLMAGQKADAIKAFNDVKGDDKTVMVAHLYTLYARSGGGAAADDAPPKKRGKR